MMAAPSGGHQPPPLVNGMDKLRKMGDLQNIPSPSSGSMDYVNKSMTTICGPPSSSSLTSCSKSADELMQQIRRRQNSKSWNDLIKMARTILQDKRQPIMQDMSDRLQLQKCLDTMQKSIKISSLQSMIERLETITRQMGLKFTAGPTGQDVFISSDMFYVEVVLEPSTGYVLDVKIAHQGDPISCSELTRVLREADFSEFHRHLDGLAAIYQLNTDKKQKSKAYLALLALETDLNTLAQIQNLQINDPYNLVHRSPVGILEPRRGGNPLKLTYFISPYELLDPQGHIIPLSVDVVNTKKLGYHATICIESCTSTNKLQTTSLLSITKTPEGRSLPQFAPLNSTNSCTLPACFVLRLPKPMPMSMESVAQICAITGIDIPESANQKPRSLLELIAAQQFQCSEDEMTQNFEQDSPHLVSLPDQSHAYYMSGGGCWTNLDAIQVTCIPFNHPTCVAKILNLLRQQVLFNVLIGSCIRRPCDTKSTTGADMETDQVHMFELSASSISSISVSFEHPVEQSLATIDFDLKDLNVKANLYDQQRFVGFFTNELASKVIQRCLSIPVTMRTIIKRCVDKANIMKEELRKKEAAAMSNKTIAEESFGAPNGTSDNGMSRFQSADQQQQQQQQQRLNATTFEKNGNYFRNNASPMGQVTGSNNLQNMLHQQQPPLSSQQQQQYQQHMANQQQMHSNKPSNAMLMTMLSDVPAANSQMSNVHHPPSNYGFHPQQQPNNAMALNALQANVKLKTKRKRKGTNINEGLTNNNQNNNSGMMMMMGMSGGNSNMICSPVAKRKLSEDEFRKRVELPEGEDELMMIKRMKSNNNHIATAGSGSGVENFTPSSTAAAAAVGGQHQKPNSCSKFGSTGLKSDPGMEAAYLSNRHGGGGGGGGQPSSMMYMDTSGVQVSNTGMSGAMMTSSSNSTSSTDSTNYNQQQQQSFNMKQAPNFLENSTFDFKRKPPTDQAGAGGSGLAGVLHTTATSSSSSASSTYAQGYAQGSDLNTNVLGNHYHHQQQQQQSSSISSSTSSHPQSAQPALKQSISSSSSFTSIPMAVSNNLPTLERRHSIQNMEMIMNGNLIRKERKRSKQSDLIESMIKSSSSASSLNLMPPPTPPPSTSTGGGGSSSSNNIGQQENANELCTSSVGSPALRPITLNVKSNSVPVNQGVTTTKFGPLGRPKLVNSPRTNEMGEFNLNPTTPGGRPLSKLKQKKLMMMAAQQKAKNLHSMSSGMSISKTMIVSSSSPNSGVYTNSSSSSSSGGGGNGGQVSLNTPIPSPSSNNSPSSSTVASPSAHMSPVSPGMLKAPGTPGKSGFHPLSKKNNKGSLSAVIDKLRVNASYSGDEQQQSVGSSSSGTMMMMSGSGELMDSSSGVTSSSIGNAGSSPSNKMNELKSKYNRPEFTVKQGSGNSLKLTVTKTKGQQQAPPIGSTTVSTTGSSLHNQKGGGNGSKTSSGIKRQWNPSGNFKNGQPSQKQQQQPQGPLSPESAGQILGAALGPRIDMDKLPKIPKTANSQQQQQQQQATSAASQQSSQQQPVSSMANQNVSSSTSNNNNASGSFTSGKSSLAPKYGSNMMKQLLPPPPSSQHMRHPPPPPSMQHPSSLHNMFPPINIAQPPPPLPPQASGPGMMMSGGLMPPPSHYRKFGSRELPPPPLPSHPLLPPSHSTPLPLPPPPPPLPPPSPHNNHDHLTSQPSSMVSMVTSIPPPPLPSNRSDRTFAFKSDMYMSKTAANEEQPSQPPSNRLAVVTDSSSSTPSSPMDCGSTIEMNPKTPTLIPTEAIDIDTLSNRVSSSTSSDLKSKVATEENKKNDEEKHRLSSIDSTPSTSTDGASDVIFKNSTAVLLKSASPSKSIIDSSTTGSLMTSTLDSSESNDAQPSSSCHTLPPTSSSSWKSSLCMIDDDDLMDEALIGTAD